jgi:hypothetical protein
VQAIAGTILHRFSCGMGERTPGSFGAAHIWKRLLVACIPKNGITIERCWPGSMEAEREGGRGGAAVGCHRGSGRDL